MKKRGFLAIIAVSIVFLAACGSGPQAENIVTTNPPTPTASAAPVETEAPSLTATATVTPSPSAEAPEPAIAQETVAPTETPPAAYSAIPLPGEMRAMWISFIEFQDIDISTEEALRANISQMYDNCASLGLNTVIVAVHPFMDALYESAYFPWSHLVTGTQGQDPGYDPMAVMVEEAHARGLRFEAWLNPYRVQHPIHGPDTLSADNPATINPAWARDQDGLWLDPGLPEVRALVVNSVTEIVENYDVDGIHFDDYFYPEGNTSAFDAETYEQYGAGMDLAAWRRENVNEMIRGAYAAVKTANPSVSFGVSPQGNNENNYNEQHCDIKLWMAEPGYADYIMPQLYWGFNYIKDGSNKASFANKTAEWAGYPLHEDVRLYAGLGAYRIGDGDYSDNSQGEWQNGHSVADMVGYLREADGFSGFALFHYDSLYPPQGSGYPDIASQEVSALAAALQQ